MKIQPLGERIVLEQQKQEEKTAGGIYIPESAKEDKKEGIVKAVGTKEDGSQLPVKIGDKVIYGGYSSTEIDSNNTTYIILDFKDVVAKLE